MFKVPKSDTKWCNSCSTEKPLEAFGNSGVTTDKKQYCCLGCTNQDDTSKGKVRLTRGQLNYNVADGFKVCYVCTKTKTLEEFSGNASRADGKQTYCKQCGKEKQSQWYYQRKHKITIERRDEILLNQNGKCLICGNTTEFKFKQGNGKNIGDEAVVDHCHTSNKIRGVLCGFCNTGLGAFKDNINSLSNAITYLQHSIEK